MTIACGCASGQVALRHDDRRRLHAVLRPHRGAGAVAERADHGEVLLLAPNACMHPRRGEALRCGDAHTSTPFSRNPAVSSRPSARFAFCTAWPAAPLPRLSSAQMTIEVPVALVGEDADLRSVGALHARKLRRHAVRQHTDDRARCVGILEQRANVGVGLHVTRREQAAPHGKQVRHEADRDSRAAARSRVRGGARRPRTARDSRARRPRASSP